MQEGKNIYQNAFIKICFIYNSKLLVNYLWTFLQFMAAFLLNREKNTNQTDNYTYGFILTDLWSICKEVVTNQLLVFLSVLLESVFFFQNCEGNKRQLLSKMFKIKIESVQGRRGRTVLHCFSFITYSSYRSHLGLWTVYSKILRHKYIEY